ncbi:MAG TPA: DICT sensory domain-containing protein [Planctomycetota bacterium]|nr:DICT sensory domain-containing protein [Planctomycetota bacterium]
MSEPISPFHDLITDIQKLRDNRDPAPLFGRLDGDLLSGEYHFTSSEATLTFMSRCIENACFADPGRCTLYSVFRRLSLLEPHLDHYHNLAAVARNIYVIGVPDVKVERWAPNVHLITDGIQKLGNNWVTINISRDIHMTLLAEELPPEGKHPRYVGFYTDSRALTRRVIRQLVDMSIIRQPELFNEEQLEATQPQPEP